MEDLLNVIDRNLEAVNEDVRSLAMDMFYALQGNPSLSVNSVYRGSVRKTIAAVAISQTSFPSRGNWLTVFVWNDHALVTWRETFRNGESKGEVRVPIDGSSTWIRAVVDTLDAVCRLADAVS